IAGLLSIGLADSRRPINDVWVSDIGTAGAAFFKAALAKCLIESQVSTNIQWRFLQVAVDAYGFYEQIERIPALLARRDLLARCLNSVREEFEVQTPLGNEIYRGDTGSVFLVPDLGPETETALAPLAYERWKGAHESAAQEISCEVRLGP